MIYCPIGFWGGSFATGKTCSINRESYIVAPGDNRESPGHGMEGGFPEESESRISIGFVKYNGRKKMKKKKKLRMPVRKNQCTSCSASFARVSTVPRAFVPALIIASPYLINAKKNALSRVRIVQKYICICIHYI